jgi:hypothetical protein
MAETDRLRVAQWFQGLSPGVQQAFQRVADEQPALAVKALSNGTVTVDPNSKVDLSQLFALSDDDKFKNLAPNFGVWEAAAEPEHPGPDTAFTVRYSVMNSGSLASAPRRDVVRIYEADGTTVLAEQPVEGKPLANGESEQLSATFAQGVTEGLRYPQVVVNLDGAPPGGSPNEHGMQAYENAAALQVGVYATAIGPETAGQTYYTQISAAATYLQNASQHQNAGALPELRSGLTALGTALAAAAGDFSADTTLASIASGIQQEAQSTQYLNDHVLQQAWPEGMQELIIALYTAVVPLQTLQYDRTTVARFAPPVMERVGAVMLPLYHVR